MLRTNRVKCAVCCDIHPRSERTFACRVTNVMALKSTSVVCLVPGHPLIKLSKRGDKLPCPELPNEASFNVISSLRRHQLAVIAAVSRLLDSALSPLWSELSATLLSVALRILKASVYSASEHIVFLVLPQLRQSELYLSYGEIGHDALAAGLSVLAVFCITYRWVDWGGITAVAVLSAPPAPRFQSKRMLTLRRTTAQLARFSNGERWKLRSAC